LQQQLDSMRQDAHSKDLTIVQGQKDIDRAESDVKRIGARLETLSREEREIEEELSALGVEQADAQRRLEEDGAALAEIEVRSPELADRAHAAREQVEAAQAEVTDLKVRAASLGEKVQAVARGRERNARARHDEHERVQ